jgi:hypothetical protein
VDHATVQRWMVDLRQHPVLTCTFKDTLMKRETLLYRFPGGHRAIAVLLAIALSWQGTCVAAVPASAELHDAHFHLTNYIQEGTDINDLLTIMGDKVGRVALFGIPLQQTWSYGNTGEFAPSYCGYESG